MSKEQNSERTNVAVCSPSKANDITEPPSEPLPHTTKEKYARLRAQGAKQVDAVKNCKISKNTAGRWEKDSSVKARINFLVSQTLQDQRGENKAQYRKITIDRNDIIMGLADVARNKKAGDRARVAAWAKLADIFMLVPKSIKDIREFYGYTVEELAEYHRTKGKFIPERYRPYVGDGTADEAGESPSLRGEKSLSGPK